MVTFQTVKTSSYICAECGMEDSPGVDGYAAGHHAGYLLCDACAVRALTDEVSSQDLDNTEGGGGGETMEDLVVLEVSVPRSWLTRHQAGLWYCGRVIPPAQIINVTEAPAWAASPVQDG